MTVYIGNVDPDGIAAVKSGGSWCMTGAGTPATKRADASQVAFTDSTTGTVADTIAAGVGIYYWPIHLNLAGITGNVDVLTTFTPGHKFKIMALDFYATTIASTASKLATLNLEIGTTNLTGGAVALTTSSCGTLGAVTAGSAVTAANTGSASDTVSLEASSVTAFVEGSGTLMIKIQNMDTADAFASIADKFNEVRTVLTRHDIMTGAA